MKILAILLVGCSLLAANEPELSVQVMRSNKDKAAIKTRLALVMATRDGLFDEIAHTLKTDLQESGQCEAVLMRGQLPKTKQDLATYQATGYQFVLFLSMSDDHQAITGRLYDVLDGSMLQGKKWNRRESKELWADKIAQDVWFSLMGNYGSFSSKIAYIKKTKGGLGKRITQLCLVDWNGQGETIVVSSPTILVAPSWKHDGEIIFCSQFTDRNVRLMATDLAGKAWVVFDRDGTSMGASSLSGSADVVYCHSGEIWKCSYDMQHKKTKHTLLVRDGNMCACPTLVQGGDLIYCAAGKIKRWHARTGAATSLIDCGYCTGPAYHAPSQRIAYSQKVGKTMQLCIYDLRTKTVRQMTFDAGDKIDPSWSPCGTYLVYCCTKGKTSEIMVLNTLMGTQRLISVPGQSCSCPAWSPLLNG